MITRPDIHHCKRVPISAHHRPNRAARLENCPSASMSFRSREPIAVVGSACRFAGDISSPTTLWNLLRAPVDVLREIPPSRYNPDGFYHQHASHHGHTNVRHAYLLNEDVAAFDAEFFGVKLVEAKAMDPQQRFLLEVAYEALESAGMTVSSLRGSDTGVYVGVMFNDYGTMLLRDFQDIPTYYATGTGQSILSNRLSYYFDWHGPSMTVDTACSSSLVAVHLAVQALRAGDCRTALASGTNLMLGPEGFVIESKLNMLSPDGRSRMWDQDANGYARGDGVACIVLKTLSAALQDGDHIECVLRETGINQDGATPGITMPSALAQEALIRRTYVRAGLDLGRPSDRPQYFEAHGTGTPAGDPVEAEAVYKTFFTCERGQPYENPLALGRGHPLYVGSIKTVLGHTEGTAGVAALIKASLALQHGSIPPNLLLERVSDRVSPFYKNVQIQRVATEWPATGAHEVRRVSVNSFGFGGTNTHAIVESYDNPPGGGLPSSQSLYTPFVFSAASETSLRGSLVAYMAYLDTCPDVNPQDLAWTLRQRRSILPIRASFAVSSLRDLRDAIAAKLEGVEVRQGGIVGTKALSASPASRGIAGRILGIFTGQGAQYARMAAELIEQSPLARKIFRTLEQYLAEIPEEAHRPPWSLEEEVLRDAPSSRVHEAELSQPLCTAVQVLVVDLLQHAGVRFSAVVGHSSGEIAAAYTAGYLSARDAMCIAYYRGRHASQASSPNGREIRGAMMAVGSSMEDIAELCADELFERRLSVAASNSPFSVTVSGDEDAIAEFELVMDDEDKFHRRLKVDKAYHSNHMDPCFDPYVASLQALGILPQVPASSQPCVWFSSVDGGRPVDPLDPADMERLKDVYWAENSTKPVLFSQAVEAALGASSFGVALEVGPHSALKAPAMQTIEHVLGRELPYHGVLSRGASAVSASSAAMGFLWSHLDHKKVDLDQYERAVSGTTGGGEERKHPYRVIKDLPTYQWNHETRHWHESRISRKMRLRPQPVHPLLGDNTPDSAPHHMQWRNLLRVSEMQWLSGHAVQGQTVFPAAGYLATAIEASRLVFSGSTEGNDGMRLVEMNGFTIHQAVPFGQDDAGIEVIIHMANITRGDNVIRSRFEYVVASDTRSDDLALAASADVVIHLGECSRRLLPRRGAPLPHTIEVEAERFYSALGELGYNFEGRFRALTALQRRRGRASGLVKMPSSSGLLLIHPAELDAVLQSAILAYSYPYDEELRTLHLPTSIRCIRINPAALQDGEALRAGQEGLAPVEASINFGEWGQKTAGSIVANVNFYATHGPEHDRPHAAVQVQGVAFMPLGGAANPGLDRLVYSKERWIPNTPDGIAAAHGLWDDDEVRHLARLLERVATFYLCKFDREVLPDHPARTSFPTNCYLRHARYVADMVACGRHPWWEDGWALDTRERIWAACAPHMHLPDFQVMHLVGTQMPRVFEGDTTMLEEFRAGGNDILDHYYAQGIGLRHLASWVARAVKQIVDVHPHMDLLEVGAGTGGATKAIFNEIEDAFSSYTYTDISAGFFETASTAFSSRKNKMIYRTLDIEKDPLQQAMPKPGGYLVIGEGADNGSGTATSGFIFGTLPGWWVGTDKGRELTPLIAPQQWDSLLRSTGFSGTDATPPFSTEDVFNVFPVVSQAVDNRVNLLRDPLAPSSLEDAGVTAIRQLILVGGQRDSTAHLIQGIQQMTNGRQYALVAHAFKTLEKVDIDLIDDETVVVSLADLDSPVFQDITPNRFHALKQIFGLGKRVLWVTSGRRADQPYANMMVAFARCAAHEILGLRLQQIDIPNPESDTALDLLARALLRFHATLAMADRNNTDSPGFTSTIEPEIVIDDQGRHLVPRLNFISELNERYNAGRRLVTRERNIRAAGFSLRLHSNFDLDGNGSYFLRDVAWYETELWGYSNGSEPWVELRTVYTTLSAIKTPFGHGFIVLAVESHGAALHFAVVNSSTSVFRMSRTRTIRLDTEYLPNEDFLRTVAANLLCFTILDSLHCGQTVVVHEAPFIIHEALAMQAASKNIGIVYTTDLTDESIPATWLRLPAYLSQSELGDILPLTEPPAAFLGLSDDGSGMSGNQATMMASFSSQGATVMTKKTLFLPAGRFREDSSAHVANYLRRAYSQALSRWDSHNDAATKGSSTPSTEMRSHIPLSDLVCSSSLRLDPLCVVNWTGASPVPVQTARLDSGPMFKSTGATYWIVGMSGALGISVADWMISRGAKNLVMSSRNPEIEADWITSHRRLGAVVTIVACDVTDEIALQAAHKEICGRLPPIRGAIHGAMVLRDVAISNMSFEQLTDVVRPKVDGSIYLDRIFQDVDLDFFLLVSSVNTVIGNRGQANYAAANAFMCSLAAQRRQRGLRAAAVNGGAIIGAGYMERDARRTWDRIAQNNWMMRMSEDDFVQSVCEGIDACRLESPHGPEISTGLNFVPADAKNAPFWASDPRFSAFIVHEDAVNRIDGKVQEMGNETTASIQSVIRGCQSHEEVYEAVKHAFANTLRAVLQATMSDEDLMASRSSEIGLDSLVSVNIRSWFLKHLQVGVPVLKIMGNDTMQDLARFAVDAMPAELVPQLHLPLAGAAGAETDTSGQPGTESPSPPQASSLNSPPSTPQSGAETDKGPDESTKSSTISGIDWDAESDPTVDLLSIPWETHQPVPCTPPRVVVLTGAGGLFGRHLLSYLLTHTPVERVICIAVRNLAQRLEGGELPPPDPRVEYHEGDLEAPRLGLSATAAASVFARADAAIHNGADTSHLKPYPALRAANVGSTRALARLCLPRRVPLHYVSSAGLALLGRGRTASSFPPVRVTGPPNARPPADGAFGYACAKWACEALLERTHRHYYRSRTTGGDDDATAAAPTWSVCIHRPSTIVREGADALGERARRDWVHALLVHAARLRAVPRLHRNRGALDLVSVRRACEELVARVVRPGEDPRLREGRVGYVHLVGDRVIPLDRLREEGLRVRDAHGDGTLFEELPMAEWIDSAVKDGLHPAVAALVEMMDQTGGPDYPRLLREVPEGYLDEYDDE
ncbi:putative polyketide synthase [Xylariomycetidae sp. FL0641]|nr:putative polyketide synthase [Xylariomycetidae sp. FL0641]